MVAGIVSAVLLASFVGGWIWAWRPARRAAFDAAARLPLDEDTLDEGALDQDTVQSIHTEGGR